MRWIVSSRAVVAAAVFSMLCSGVLGAQGVTTGAIAGTTTDSAGAPLDGARVGTVKVQFRQFRRAFEVTDLESVFRHVTRQRPPCCGVCGHLEYAFVRTERTRRVIARIRDEDLEWEAAPGRFTPGDIVRHLAGIDHGDFVGDP